MDRFAMLFLAGIGPACICAGYKLFCGLPAMSSRRASRASVLLLNIIPGALLALIGVGILTTAVRAVASDTPPIQRHPATDEGATWHGGKFGIPGRAA